MTFGITAKLAGLAIFVALSMTLLTGWWAGEIGRDAITKHERVDLSDEASVRRYQFEDLFRHIGFSLRYLGNLPKHRGMFNQALHQAGDADKPIEIEPELAHVLRERFADIISITPDIKAQPKDNLYYERRRATRLAQMFGGAEMILEATYLPLSRIGDPADGGARQQLKPRLDRPLQVFHRSENGQLADVSTEPAQWLFAQIPYWDGYAGIDADDPGSQQAYPVWRDTKTKQLLYAVAYLIRDDRGLIGMIVLTLDFGRLVRLVSDDQPRVVVIVTDNDGRVLVSPDHKDLLHLGEDKAPRIQSFQMLDPFHPFFPGSQESDSTLRRFRGLTIDEAKLPGLEFDYVRQWAQGNSADFFQDPERAARIDRALDQLRAEGTIFRFNSTLDTVGSLGVACPPGTGPAVMKQIDAIERQLAPGEALPAWDSPVTCKTFAVNLTKMASEISEGDQFGLITAASLEEMQNSINDSMSLLWWTIPFLCLASGVVAWGLARQLTRPLLKITEAARLMARGDFTAPLPSRRHDEIGLLAGAFGAMRDQLDSRRRELREALARMQTVLDTAAEGIISFDQEGKIESFNQAAERMFGRSSQEMIGQRIQSLIELPAQTKQANSSNAQSAVLRYMAIEAMLQLQDRPLYGKRLDDSKFWLEVAFSEVPLDEGHRLITGIFRDITLRKAAEEQALEFNLQLQKLNAELDERVRRRTAELEENQAKLERALQDAQTAVKAKDSFVARVSHELRNPLAIILGYNEALQEEITDRELDDLLPDLQKIHASGSHLLSLVNDILDHAKIEAGELKLDIRDTSLDPVIKDLVTLAQPLAAPNGNTFAVDTPEHLGAMKTDPKRLKQILLNLLSNACKFTEKGTVTLRVTRELHERSEWITFAVSDTGRGMTHDEMKGLFRPFYQVEGGHTRKAGGTGLGLSITKSLAEQMGGTVTVSSEIGRGSTFAVRVPVAGPPTATPRTPVNHDMPTPSTRPASHYRPKDLVLELPPLKANTILVIDDDANVRDLMERFLTKEGYSVITAASGEDGLRLAKQLRPAAITLDVMMPGIDGWAMLAALKTDAYTHDIPVVMLTILDDRGRGFALGAADYVTKPIDWGRLGSILKKHASMPGAPILIIDDDRNHRELISRWLTKEGWPVLEAGNGIEGLKQLEEHRPALILLDLMMPEMDGFGFVEELRRREEYTGIPVVMITAKDLTAEDIERLNGCVGEIISKQALSQDDLLKHVRTCVQRYTATPLGTES